MGIKERYASIREALLTDKSICVENRATLKKYFEWHENKLKRIMGGGTVEKGVLKPFIPEIPTRCIRFA